MPAPIRTMAVATGGGGGEAQRLLEIRRGEEVDSKQAECPEHERDGRPGEGAVVEQGNVQHRVLRAAFDGDEGDAGDQGGGERGNDGGGGPADLRALDQGVGERQQGGGGGRDPLGVDAPVSGPADGRDRAGAEPQGEDPDRNVDEEDPMPVDVLRKDPRAAARRRGRPRRRRSRHRPPAPARLVRDRWLTGSREWWVSRVRRRCPATRGWRSADRPVRRIRPAGTHR